MKPLFTVGQFCPNECDIKPPAEDTGYHEEGFIHLPWWEVYTAGDEVAYNGHFTSLEQARNTNLQVTSPVYGIANYQQIWRVRITLKEEGIYVKLVEWIPN